MKTERKSNFELLRIVSMLMVVLSHCIYHGIMKAGQPDAFAIWNAGSFAYKIFSSISILGTIGVGLFFMVSGYFTAHKEHTSIKKVSLTTLFYAIFSVLVTVIARIGGINLFATNGDMLLNTAQLILVPVTGSVWWFVTAYIVMMLIAPFYNRYLERLNRRGMLLWIGFVLLFGYALGNLGSNFHDLEKAVLFYTMGVYYRDYENVGSGHKRTIYICCAIVGIALNGLCQFGISTYSLMDSTKAVLLRKAFSMMGYLIAAACMLWFIRIICEYVTSKQCDQWDCKTYIWYLSFSRSTGDAITDLESVTSTLEVLR